MQQLVLIGYFPKKVVRRPDWLKAPAVSAIRSASECSSPGPPDWIRHWTHNEMWVYSTIAAALAAVPEADRSEYELHAYRILPFKWDQGNEIAVSIPPLDVESLSSDFRSIGFDAVSIQNGVAGFGCSPLSCNHMAQEIATNEHCLLEDVETAMRTALEFSRGNVEPGPYYVVEVLLRRPVG
jgi:hypothetical protein